MKLLDLKGGVGKMAAPVRPGFSLYLAGGELTEEYGLEAFARVHNGRLKQDPSNLDTKGYPRRDEILGEAVVPVIPDDIVAATPEVNWEVHMQTLARKIENEAFAHHAKVAIDPSNVGSGPEARRLFKPQEVYPTVPVDTVEVWRDWDNVWYGMHTKSWKDLLDDIQEIITRYDGFHKDGRYYPFKMNDTSYLLTGYGTIIGDGFEQAQSTQGMGKPEGETTEIMKYRLVRRPGNRLLWGPTKDKRRPYTYSAYLKFREYEWTYKELTVYSKYLGLAAIYLRAYLRNSCPWMTFHDAVALVNMIALTFKECKSVDMGKYLTGGDLLDAVRSWLGREIAEVEFRSDPNWWYFRAAIMEAIFIHRQGGLTMPVDVQGTNGVNWIKAPSKLDRYLSEVPFKDHGSSDPFWIPSVSNHFVGVFPIVMAFGDQGYMTLDDVVKRNLPVPKSVVVRNSKVDSGVLEVLPTEIKELGFTIESDSYSVEVTGEEEVWYFWAFPYTPRNAKRHDQLMTVIQKLTGSGVYLKDAYDISPFYVAPIVAQSYDYKGGRYRVRTVSPGAAPSVSTPAHAPAVILGPDGKPAPTGVSPNQQGQPGGKPTNTVAPPTP